MPCMRWMIWVNLLRWCVCHDGNSIIINIGMCLGVLPVIGVTLPFLSAGGTSTGTLYLGIGVVLSVYMHSGKDMLFA